MKRQSLSVEETLALGRRIGHLAPPGQITCIALHGELGAGKTHLTRGIAEGAAVNDPTLVSSPTYVLMNIYEGPKPVYHLDAYRLHGTADLASLGVEELFAPTDAGKIIVIEWAARIADALPADHLAITLEHAGDPGEDHRTLDFIAHGPASSSLLEALGEPPRAR